MVYDVSRLGQVLHAPGSDKLSAALSADAWLYQLLHAVSYPVRLPAGHGGSERKREEDKRKRKSGKEKERI